MIPKKSKRDSETLRPHNYGLFMVTHEVFNDVGGGKMACLTTGEVLDKETWSKRGKGTSLKVTLTA